MIGLCGRNVSEVNEFFLVDPVVGLGDPMVNVAVRDLHDEGDVGRGGKGTVGGMDGKSSVLRADLSEWTDGGRVELLTILILVGSMANDFPLLAWQCCFVLGCRLIYLLLLVTLFASERGLLNARPAQSFNDECDVSVSGIDPIG